MTCTCLPPPTMRRAMLMLLALSGAFTLDAAHAQDRADLDRTRITGNRELPKVLYIVPWKKPVPGELAGRPLVSVLDEALAPLDRDVVRREQQYDASTRARATTPQTASAKPATP